MNCHIIFAILFTIVCLQHTPSVLAQETSHAASIIAAWDFDGNVPALDISGKKHAIKLRGKDSHFVNADGAGVLSIEEKVQPGDTRQGAVARNTGDLNPDGAFTVEMRIAPNQALANKDMAYLLDKKYYHYKSEKESANKGYLLLLRKTDDGKFIIEAQLGFGKDSAVLRSEPQMLKVDKWHLVTFTYDGNGRGVFYLDKLQIGNAQLKGRGAIAPSSYDLIIGDRVYGVGHRFLGKIDDVRLLNEAIHYYSGKVLLKPADSRSAFYRMEENAQVRLKVTNDSEKTRNDITLHVSTEATNTNVNVPEIAPGKSTFIEVPLNSRLRPGAYDITITPRNDAADTVGDAIQMPVHIIPRRLPHEMPVIMWGVANRSYNIKSYTELAELGFTGQLMYSAADYKYIWENGAAAALPDDRVMSIRKRLDQMMLAGVQAHLSISPGGWADSAHPEFNKTDRLGKALKDIDGLYPEIQQYSFNAGAALANSYHDMPAWKGTLINTEVRDDSAPSFNEIDKKTYREFSGHDIPSEVSGARGISYHSLENFPKDRIIPGDNPILTYYKWFWKQGDGWPKLISQVSDGIKSTGRKDTFTWFDPSVRAPSIYGSGGNVDVLNHWTYSYPNPLDVGLAADQQLAMAGANPGQKVMNMIQVIWYRSRTTKAPIKGHEAEWEKISPDAQFISIAPDHLSEGTWLELARPIVGIANHGWGSMGDKLGYSSGRYVTTNIETRKRIKDINHHVIRPLGPTLQQVPDYRTDVAFLESFTSQMFAGRGTYGGGNGWGADSFMIARYAGLQPQIVYEETVAQKGLDQYKVLFVTDCDVLPQSVADAIAKFQQRGGIVIGDDHLAPGISPDIALMSIKRTDPDVTKKRLLQAAQQLREELNGFYAWPVSSSNADVITRLRQFGKSRYLFTVNDHRTYGDYVGQHKIVMEKGLPSSAQITLNRESAFVYDLMQHRQVMTQRANQKVLFPVELEAGGGNVFLITDKPVGKLEVQATSSMQRGGDVPVKVLLCDNTGKPLDAVVPLQVTITDAAGNVAEKSGYYGAAHGALGLELNIAPNDVKGKWKIEVRENVTGQIQVATFEVL